VHILEMTKRIHINDLLAVCTALVGFGILTIAISPGFFMNLLGAGMMGTGGRRCLSHLVPSVRTSITPNALGRFLTPRSSCPA
jgi:hypothetical protein